MFRIKQYITNSSIHGFHYITEPKRHWTERIFWTVVCCLSGFYTWMYLNATWYAFRNNAVSFVMETDHLDWNTTFPAVSICEQESPDKLYDVANELFGVNRDMNLDFYLRDIAFFDGSCYSCSTHCINGDMNCTEDFDLLIGMIRESCEELIEKCTWNGEPFECCDNFLPLPTENGLCFSINSIHTKRKKNSMPKLVSNRKTGPGTLQLEAYESIKVFVHATEDVPYVNHPQDEKALLNWGSTYNMKIQVKEIENDRNLPLVDVDQRNCRLPEENYLDTYEYYSYSTCVVNCRAKAQMALCNCTSHYIPYKNKGMRIHIGERKTPTCGVAGLGCLTFYAETLRALRSQDLKKLGVECRCISSCNEPEYNIILSDIQMTKHVSGATFGTKISIGLDRLPNERYKRNVVRTRLDLVVSVGGTVGLFLGASLLSIVELLYYIFIRMHSFNLEELQKIRRGKKENENGRRLFDNPKRPVFTSSTLIAPQLQLGYYFR